MTNHIDHNKFANAVLYLLHGCRDRPGLTKLLKLLFHTDFEHYRKHLRPITGAAYLAGERGPVPDGYGELLDHLVEGGVVERREVQVQGAKPKVEFIPRRAPNSNLLEESEIEILDFVLATHGGMTGQMLSDMTHLDGPWTYSWDPSNPCMPIPYATGRWLDNMCDDDDLAQAQEHLADPDVTAFISQLDSTSDLR